MVHGFRVSFLPTLKSSGMLSSLLRGGPKRPCASSLDEEASAYAGGACVKSLLSSWGSFWGAGWYFVVEAIINVFASLDEALRWPFRSIADAKERDVAVRGGVVARRRQVEEGLKDYGSGPRRHGWLPVVAMFDCVSLTRTLQGSSPEHNMLAFVKIGSLGHISVW